MQGCISISMSLHQTSFCFVCSHLASGEKEGDEIKRNADVAEILKSTQFQKICKTPCRAPERIVDHEYVCFLKIFFLFFYVSFVIFHHIIVDMTNAIWKSETFWQPFKLLNGI